MGGSWGTHDEWSGGEWPLSEAILATGPQRPDQHKGSTKHGFWLLLMLGLGTRT